MNYPTETTKLIKDIASIICAKKALSIQEININWETKKVINAGENDCGTSDIMIVKLVPNVTIKFK